MLKNITFSNESENANIKSATFLMYDTLNRISIYYNSRDPLEKAIDLCERFDFLFNKFRTESDVWNVTNNC